MKEHRLELADIFRTHQATNRSSSSSVRPARMPSCVTTVSRGTSSDTGSFYQEAFEPPVQFLVGQLVRPFVVFLEIHQLQESCRQSTSSSCRLRPLSTAWSPTSLSPVEFEAVACPGTRNDSPVREAAYRWFSSLSLSARRCCFQLRHTRLDILYGADPSEIAALALLVVRRGFSGLEAGWLGAFVTPLHSLSDTGKRALSW